MNAIPPIPDDVEGLMAQARTEKPDPLPPGFFLTDEGLFYRDPGNDDAGPQHVCGALRVIAATSDGSGHAWGVLLEWQDDNGQRHQWAMPRAMLAGDGQEVRARLMDAGLYVAPTRGARNRLAEYLTRAKSTARVRVVNRLGWHETRGGRVFVLPFETFGAANAERVMLQTERPDAMPPLATSGILEEWQSEVAAHAAGNSRLALSISAAFAAPLLGPLNAEGGGFHLRGPSSIGKSTALCVAGSVWGGGGLRGWLKSWRATDNSLEAVGTAHCDLLACLDEMGEAGGEVVAKAAYMLANGTGKGRAAQDGAGRRAKEFRILFLSTGEEGIADRMAEARGGPQRARAGQEVRVLDIPAEAGPHGLFETLSGFNAPDALSDHLKGAAARFYGTAGRAWLERLAADPEGFTRDAREVIAAFIAAHVPETAAGQVRRAAQRFALVAAGGELATAEGILPWMAGEAERAAAVCFKAWLGRRAGGIGAAEDASALAAVRGFILAHGTSRFEVWRDDDAEEPARVINRAGWRKRDRDQDGQWLYLIPPVIWTGEVVRGMDGALAAAALRRRGFLKPQNDRAKKHTRMERVGGAKSVCVYAVRDAILSGEDEP